MITIGKGAAKSYLKEHGSDNDMDWLVFEVALGVI